MHVVIEDRRTGVGAVLLRIVEMTMAGAARVWWARVARGGMEVLA